MLLNWLKIAIFNYKKNWISTFINIFGLTLGLTCLTLIIMHWQDEKSYESWNPNKDKVYAVENVLASFGVNQVSSYPFLVDAKENFKEIEDFAIANVAWDKIKLMNGKKAAFVKSAKVSQNFFEFFPFEKVAGNYQDALNSVSKIALSESTAKQLFGENIQDCIGKLVSEDNTEKNTYVVTAVYQLPVSNSAIKPDFVVLHPNLVKSNNTQWLNFSYVSYFKIKPHTDIPDLEKRMEKRFAIHEKIEVEKWGEKYNEVEKTQFFLTPLTQMKLESKTDYTVKQKRNLTIAFLLSTLILVLSGINLINLKTAQATQRAKEVGIRKAIGVSKINIFFQFIFENTILCVISYVFAFTIIELILPYFNSFLDKQIQLDNIQVYWVSLWILLVVILVSGSIPVIYLLKFKPIQTLKGNFSQSNSGVWMRNVILTLQLVISSFFIIGALVMHLQLKYMMNKDLGFKGDQVLYINFNKTDYRNPNFNFKKFNRLKSEVLKFPGVKAVTGSAFIIAGHGFNATSVKNAVDTTQIINTVIVGAVDYNYVDFYQIKLLSGRMINPKLATDTISGVVANETFIKAMHWNAQQAIGKEVIPGWSENKKSQIIGVVKDFNINSVDRAIDPILLFNYDRNDYRDNLTNLQVKLNAADIGATLERIKTYWESKVEPGYPFDYFFIDKEFARTFEKYQKQQTLFTVLNVVVLLVALLGLFALSSLLIEQRLKEVAIRKVLGASEGEIVMNLTKKFLYITLIAVLISMPFSYYFMNEWLKDFAYRIEMPIWPYLLSLVMLLVLTFLVVSIKAYRATQVNLVKYLKYE